MKALLVDLEMFEILKRDFKPEFREMRVEESQNSFDSMRYRFGGVPVITTHRNIRKPVKRHKKRRINKKLNKKFGIKYKTFRVANIPLMLGFAQS